VAERFKAAFNHIALGEDHALVTVRWAYKRSSGETIWESTFSYNVIKQSDGWKIYVQTLHD
jgi:hypothetical protein